MYGVQQLDGHSEEAIIEHGDQFSDSYSDCRSEMRARPQ